MALRWMRERVLLLVLPLLAELEHWEQRDWAELPLSLG